VELPGRQGASFRFRDHPEPDQASWRVEVARADGIVRTSWQDGLLVRQRDRRTPPRFTLFHDGQLLDDDQLSALLDDLARPVDQGVKRDIVKAWAQRFGHLPPPLLAKVEAAQDLDALDAALGGIWGAADVDEAAAPLRTLT
jgi:hypothetical protein